MKHYFTVIVHEAQFSLSKQFRGASELTNIVKLDKQKKSWI